MKILTIQPIVRYKYANILSPVKIPLHAPLYWSNYFCHIYQLHLLGWNLGHFEEENLEEEQRVIYDNISLEI